MANECKPHSGHRDRLRENYLRGGLEPLSDVNRLELLLFYGIPRRDTNPLAHRLLDTFGSLSGVLQASVDQLCSVQGMSRNAAILLHLVNELGAACIREQTHREFGNILSTTARCGEYLVPCFFGERNEVVYLLCLDAKCKLLDCRKISEGSVNAADISIRRVVETALLLGASTVVLAHNHTSGIALPSREDEAATRRVYTALDAVGVRLADHVIVADNDYVSMAESGFFDHLDLE